MKKTLTGLAILAAMTSTSALAQNTGATAPDGTPAFGIKPYVGVMATYEVFDNNAENIPNALRANGTTDTDFELQGTMVTGVAGVNVPLQAFFVGAEGTVSKGIEGEIDWQYGVAGRAGVRIGDSGLFYGKAGYQWVNFDRFRPFNDRPADTERDYGDVTYGLGFEVGPRDIGLGGITGNAGIRIRGEVATYGDFDSFRPSLGLVAHF